MASDILLPRCVATCACVAAPLGNEEELDLDRIVVCLIAPGDRTSSTSSSSSSDSNADMDIDSMMLLDALANGRGTEGRRPLSDVLAAIRFGVAVSGGDNIELPLGSASGLAVGSPSSSSSSSSSAMADEEFLFRGLVGLIEDIDNESPKPPNESTDGLLGRESEPSRDDR